MPFMVPKITGGNNAANGNAAGRTTFRPPWVKDDAVAAASTAKTATPWAKKATATGGAATAAAEKDKPNATAVSTNNQKSKAATNGNGNSKAAEAAVGLRNSNKPSSNGIVTNTKTTKPAEPAKKAVEQPAVVPKKLAPTHVNATKTPPAKTSVAKALPKPGVASTNAKSKPAAVVVESDDDDDEEETESESEEEEEEEEEEDESEETEESESEEESEEEESEESEEEATPLPPPPPPKSATAKPAPKATPTPTPVAPKSTAKPTATPTPVALKSAAKPTPTPTPVAPKSTPKPTPTPVAKPVEDKVPEHVKKVNQLRPTTVNKKKPEDESELAQRFTIEKPKLRTVAVKRDKSLKKVTAAATANAAAKAADDDDEPVEVPAPPPLPSLVPKAPPPPPPPGGGLVKKGALTEAQQQTLEKLKTRPRRRPDWSEMMKEVEDGKKLRHVTCNDRSQPILTCKSMTKVDNKFIYETEKGNSHNKLLKQIQGGVKLKPTQTNDRSKPILDGLRKFRRQMTIEEQLQKSQSRINMLSETPSSAGTSSSASGKGTISSAQSVECLSSEDELDDIDRIRDDLQSTKQMLAIELRSREAQERENKKLLAKIATLEAELEREKSREKNLEYGSNVIVATMDPLPTREQAYVNSLKSELEDARKETKVVDANYRMTSELLDDAKTEIEEQRRQIQLLERKLAHALQGGGALNGSRRPSDALGGREGSSDFDLEPSESDPDEPPEKKAAREEKRVAKEVKNLISKLAKLKAKEETAKKEKVALKQAMKKNHVLLKQENKKFKQLEKEVEKMAASMKLDEDDEHDEDDDDTDDEVDAGERSASKNGKASSDKTSANEDDNNESESEESESEEESESAAESDSGPEDATNSEMKEQLEPRVKAHESRLTAMKKCNVLLQANVDNLQDEIMQVRSKATSLQGELDTLLADLGF